MPYALLGDIQFELLTFMGAEGKFGADYAEHPRIEGKPRLQWIGDKLDEWSLSLKFHQLFCDPEEELSALQEAMNTHAPLPFAMANGDYLGDFVITDYALTSEQTDSQGTLISASAKLTLREAIGQDDGEGTTGGPAVASAGRPLPPHAKNSLVGLARPNLPATTLKDAVMAGREVFTMIKTVNRVVTLAKNLQNNPAAAIEQLRSGLRGLDRMAKAADRLGLHLIPLQSSVGGSGKLLAMAATVATEARGGISLLADVNSANLLNRLGSVNDSLGDRKSVV